MFESKAENGRDDRGGRGRMNKRPVCFLLCEVLEKERKYMKKPQVKIKEKKGGVKASKNNGKKIIMGLPESQDDD